MALSDDQRTSVTLLEQVADLRNADAWQKFLHRYQPCIHDCARRWGLSGEDVEDITSMVLAKLAKEMGRFRYDPKRRFRAWLKTVVDNAVKDFLRKRGRQRGDRATGGSRIQQFLEQIANPVSTSVLVDELDASLRHDRQLARQAAASVQKRLQPQTWQAFWLTAIEERPGAEVAKQLGMTIGAVHQAKSRVAKMLREALATLTNP